MRTFRRNLTMAAGVAAIALTGTAQAFGLASSPQVPSPPHINPPAHVSTGTSEAGADVAGRQAGRGVPAAATPAIAGIQVDGPESVPAPCSLAARLASACAGGISTPSVDAGTPPVPSLSVATPAIPVPETCTRLVCVGAFTIPSARFAPTPPIGSVPVHVPALAVPAPCLVEGALCEQIHLPGLLEASTPAIPSQGVTPPVWVQVSTSDWTAWTQPHVGQTATVGTQQLTLPVAGIGDVHVTLFPSGIDLPMLPGAGMAGTLTLTITAGDRSFTRTIPVSV